MDLLDTLMGINTVNDPMNGVYPDKSWVDLVGAYVRSQGFSVELFEEGPYASLLAVKGRGEPIVMAMAHVDVVPYRGQKWAYPPDRLTIVGGKAYGRGTLDDKGNVAALLHAARGLKVERGTLMLAITSDEESGGRHGARLIRDVLAARGQLPRYLINADGNSEMICVRRRAAYSVTLRAVENTRDVRGRAVRARARALMGGDTRHAAYFVPGAHLHPVIALSVKATYALGVSHLRGAWVKPNVVPEWAEAVLVEGGKGRATVDVGLTDLLRAVLPVTRMSIGQHMHSQFGAVATPNTYARSDGRHVMRLDVRAMMRDGAPIREYVGLVIGEGGYDVDYEVGGDGGYLYTRPDSHIVRVAVEASARVLGAYRVGELPGASDSRYFSPLGVDAVDFGPRGGGLHGPNEYVEVDSLARTARFYRHLMETLLSA